MIKVKSEGIILEPSVLPFENQAVLNPATIEADGIVHMYYRAVRKGDMVSSIGYCQLVDNKVIKKCDKPALFPQYAFEKKGLEDPRIIKIDGTYYLFYTVYDGINALFTYATTSDLINFQKHGVVAPGITFEEAKELFLDTIIGEKFLAYKAKYRHDKPTNTMVWEKDAFLFPRKINGKYALVQRILPGIQLIYFNDFCDLTPDRWIKYLKEMPNYIIMYPKYPFENKHIGGGPPPLETKDGWLFIYHAVEFTGTETIYRAAAALLDLNDPTKVIGRLPYPLFSPEEEWEKSGDVNNVVFPSGTILKGDTLYIYYGAADRLIAAKSLSLQELLTELKKSPD
jgi:beta-1,2-mannobiose phosphorylase / 1,2-beta-oligomannan phosphorylase